MNKSQFYIKKHKFLNWYYDKLAEIVGYCNHCPRKSYGGEGGGYSFWRCARRKDHVGLHRFNNYVWSDDGKTDYVPVPFGAIEPQQPWERHNG